MSNRVYPVIDLVATGDNIKRLRVERGLTVRDVQSFFGFEEPRAIYKWQSGQTLPSVDNLYALGSLFEVPIDQILVPVPIKLHQPYSEQQVEPCCSSFFRPAVLDTAKVRFNFDHLSRFRCQLHDESDSRHCSRGRDRIVCSVMIAL